MPTLLSKVALVTGSSRGIGAAIATALAEAGARVVVNYTSSATDAEQVVSKIEAAGGQALAIQADVSDPAQVERLFDTAIAHFGQLDILVNNAGMILYKKLEDVTDDEFDQLFAVNVKGVFNTLRQAATRLADGGRVINLSSSTTRLLLPTYASYCATKAAVEQLSRIFAKEVGHRQITVNIVSPGPTHTELFDQGKTEADFKRFGDMTALGRIADPEDIANTVLLLASDEAGWITAQNLGANGGLV